MRVLRKMTRRKVTHYNTTPVTLGDIEKRIRDITSKPSYSSCGISYEVLNKMKNIVKKNNPSYDEHGLIKPLFKRGTKDKDDPESYIDQSIYCWAQDT